MWQPVGISCRFYEVNRIADNTRTKIWRLAVIVNRCFKVSWHCERMEKTVVEDSVSPRSILAARDIELYGLALLTCYGALMLTPLTSAITARPSGYWLQEKVGLFILAYVAMFLIILLIAHVVYRCRSFPCLLLALPVTLLLDVIPLATTAGTCCPAPVFLLIRLRLWPALI